MVVCAHGGGNGTGCGRLRPRRWKRLGVVVCAHNNTDLWALTPTTKRSIHVNLFSSTGNTPTDRRTAPRTLKTESLNSLPNDGRHYDAPQQEPTTNRQPEYVLGQRLPWWFRQIDLFPSWGMREMWRSLSGVPLLALRTQAFSVHSQGFGSTPYWCLCPFRHQAERMENHDYSEESH